MGLIQIRNNDVEVWVIGINDRLKFATNVLGGCVFTCQTLIETPNILELHRNSNFISCYCGNQSLTIKTHDWFVESWSFPGYATRMFKDGCDLISHPIGKGWDATDWVELIILIVNNKDRIGDSANVYYWH